MINAGLISDLMSHNQDKYCENILALINNVLRM